MSVSQVKKRFAEMESYLGRDKEALRRLKLLKDDVNVLRTSLAAAEEKAVEAEAVKEAARKRADDAEAEADAMRLDNQKMRDVHRCMEAKLRNVEFQALRQEADESDLDEYDDTVPTGDGVEAKKLMKALRRQLPQCPQLTAKESARHCPAFIRQGFSRGWSHRDIWTIGASVAIIAAHEGGVTIIDPIGTDFGGKDKKITEGMGGAFMRWFMKNFKGRDPSLPKPQVYFGSRGAPAELIEPERLEELATVGPEPSK